MRTFVVRLASLLTLLGTLVFGLTLVATPAQAQPADDPTQVPLLRERTSDSTVTADPLATVQLDGTTSIIWAQALVGTTVYAGGSFSNVHPPNTAEGTNRIPRSNLLAYDITDGSLKNWAPSVNGVVKSVAASPDGQRIYVGGSFTVANGADRYNLAAFDTSGNLISGFTAAVGGSTVNAIVATNDTVYVGGLFSAGNLVPRRNLAAFSASNGALLGWAPTTNLQVDAMVMDPTGSQLIIGGRFDQVNDASQRGMAALDLITGATLPWAINGTVKNGIATGTNAGKAGIYGLTADDNAVYGTGWVYATTSDGNLEGSFSAAKGTGDLRWIADCHGDHYAIYSDGQTVYSTSHQHACDSIGSMRNGTTNSASTRHATAVTADAKGTVIRPEHVSSIYQDFSGNPAPAEYDWYPEWIPGTASDSDQAGWSIVGNGDYIAVAGEFIGVNNKALHGIARFAKTPPNPPQSGPRLSGAAGTWTPTVKSVRQGAMLVSIPANRDRDGSVLTYEFRRAGQTQPFATVKAKSDYWYFPTVTATDTGVTTGQSYSYTVRAIDADGNTADSAEVTQTATATTAQPSYAAAVVDSGPLVYYRLGAGNTVTDSMGTANGSAAGLTNTSGAIVGDGDQASTFAGSSTSRVGSSSTFAAPDSLSYELWFKTNTTTGGELVGLGSAASGNSGTYDRAVYMSNNGRLSFASYFGVWRTMQTTSAFNDNAWHHLVMAQGLDGSTMYVDGKTVASSRAIRYGRRGFNARVRIGGDVTSAFPNAPSSQWFKGSIDDVAVYPYGLTKAQALAHRDLGVGATAPVASFSSNVSGMTAQFNAGASTVSTGRTIAGYTWDFGDGRTGTGVSPSHSYATAGTYDVTLTVTDSAGSTGSVTNPVLVHLPPTANFTHTESGLDSTFDPSSSTATGGATISGYLWDFGDGTTSTQATPVHTFPTSGTYDVSLTVTDNEGASSSPVVKSVKVKAFDAFAADAFERNVSTGWGAADVGGDWTGTTGLSVGAGVGTMSVPASVTRSTTLPVSVGDATTTFSVAVDKALAGGTAQVNYALHKSAAGDYRVKLRYLNTGEVSVWLTKVVGSTQTLLTDAGTVPGFRQTAGAALNVKVEAATSTGRTTLRTKVWPSEDPEPAAWAASTSDSESALQDAGIIALAAYANGSVSNEPLAFSFDDLDISGKAVPHAAPVANFTHSENGLTSSFDSSSTSTSDNATIASYSWDFGDGASSTQASPSHKYAAAGTYQVSLVVTDSKGSQSAPVAKSVTVTHADPNASFQMTTSDLGVTTDASGSSASDGASLSYAWNWGDGTGADSGQKASHTYKQPGTYTVRLTVTDSLGATATVTKQASVAAGNVLASDGFGRTVGTGWGNADVGGEWSGNTGFSVSGGAGQVSVPAGVTRAALLPVSVGDATTTFTISTDKAIAAGNANVNYILHHNSDGDYRLKLRYLNTGQVTVWLTRKVGSSETLLADGGAVGGFTQTAGATLNVKVDASTTGGSTTLRTKVWPTGSAEPTAWLATATDSTAGIQGPGTLGFTAYANGSVSNAPIGFTFDDLQAVGGVPAHRKPAAQFTFSTSGLTADFVGTSSTAFDNATIAQYAWTFGDGGTSTQASPSHDYAAGGTYDVTLTVSDSTGAVSDPTTKRVTVGVASVFAVDTFGRTVADGWGSADVGGDWSGSPGFSVSDGGGQVSVPASFTRYTLLPASVGDATSTFTISTDKAIAAGNANVNYILHHNSDGDYRLKLRYLNTGEVTVWLTRKVGSSETLLADGGTVGGFTQTAGATLNVKIDAATTSGTTTLRTKVWPTGSAEPTAWLATATDSTAGIQGAGTLGFTAYVNGSVSNAPIGFTFDDLNVH